MSAEIFKHDNLVLSETRAWHRMGVVLDQAISPVEASKIAFPWHAIQKPLTYKVEGRQFIVDDLMVNVRSDHPDIQLGTVSPNYQIIQPMQMAEFCEALSVEGNVKVETAGSIRNGKRIWFLCKGDAFEVGNGDHIYDYLLVSNGFDRSTSFRVTPTTIRVVCSNTLHAVIPRKDDGNLQEAAICLRHTENVFDRIEEAKAALKAYRPIQEGMREVVQKLVKTSMSQEQVQEFFLESYTADFGEVPTNPQNKVEENRRNRALQAAALFSKRFDDEREMAGASAWNALNAYTGLLQHDRKARGADDEDRVVTRIEQNLFGLSQQRSQAALVRAYRIATA